ncbi:hypothetical protein AXF42_Ash011759 [Apostasia shenzhenica]|uniref:Prolamin-like domain-containing protein n=1 Tax=Apostasia shenzhenica TaxID=1088818 RepID=A0A2H9ZUW1_9ASPA|nr:hypothetical protein AXF42_Ash011759 [Apostasia shenzhenica]
MCSWRRRQNGNSLPVVGRGSGGRLAGRAHPLQDVWELNALRRSPASSASATLRSRSTFIAFDLCRRAAVCSDLFRISPHLLRSQEPSAPRWHYPSVLPNPILRNPELRECWTHLRRPPGCMSSIYDSSDKGNVSLSRDCCKTVEALTSCYFLLIFTAKAFQPDFSQKVKDLQAKGLLFQLPHLPGGRAGSRLSDGEERETPLSLLPIRRPHGRAATARGRVKRPEEPHGVARPPDGKETHNTPRRLPLLRAAARRIRRPR